MMNGEMVPLFEKRAAFYSVLSRLYRREVDCPFLTQLKAFASPLREEPGWSDIHRVLRNAPSLASLAGRLRQEYAHLFVLGARRKLQPYESVQCTPEGLMMQEPWAEVREIYAREGLKRRDGEGEVEDHLALELAFLQQVILRSARACENGETEEFQRLLAVQEEFLSRLRGWVPPYCDAVMEAAREDLYRGLARATREVLAGDWEVLQSLVAEADGDPITVR